MNEVEFLLIQLEGFLYENYQRVLETFAEPHELTLKCKNASLIAMYNFSNGMNIKPQLQLGQMDLCSFGYFLPEEEALNYKYMFEEENYFTNKNLYPIMSSRGGDYLLVDVTQKDAKVLFYSKELFEDEPIEVYETVKSLVQTIYECFYTRAYSYDSDYFLIVDAVKEREVSIKHNPRIGFWGDEPG